MFSGMNIARALGDKFLKEQDRAFSALPHISDVRRLTVESIILLFKCLVAGFALGNVVQNEHTIVLFDLLCLFKCKMTS
jgi:hypothetical protein